VGVDAGGGLIRHVHQCARRVVPKCGRCRVRITQPEVAQFRVRTT
jgi:ferredoxin